MPIWKRVVMRSKNPTKWKKTRTFENNIYFIINNYAILKNNYNLSHMLKEIKFEH